MVCKLASSLSDSPWTALAAAITVGLCFPVTIQFYPGRIDHHGLQIVLALATALAIISSDKRPSYALVAGALCGISLWVGIESAPYVAAACIAVSVSWALRHAYATRRLISFAISFACVTSACLYISAPPASWSPVCDAISPVYAVLALAIASAMGIAALIGGVITKKMTHTAAVERPIQVGFARVIIISSLGLLAVGVTVGLFSQCLRGPYSQLDPRLVEVWLSNVTEARPLHIFILKDHTTGLALIMVPILAILGLFFGYPKGPIISKTLNNSTARTLLIFMCVTALTGLIQSRMLLFSGAVGAPLAAAFIARIADAVDSLKHDVTRALARFAVFALLSPMLLPFVIGELFPSEAQKRKDTAKAAKLVSLGANETPISCTDPDAVHSLRALPTGFAITQIDLGAAVLAGTQHSVSTAPYHRNEAGLMAALDVYMATHEADAQQVVMSLNADYVFACKDSSETDLMLKLEPNSLLAQLLEGHTPDWLMAIPTGIDNPILMYEVKKPNQ